MAIPPPGQVHPAHAIKLKIVSYPSGLETMIVNPSLTATARVHHVCYVASESKTTMPGAVAELLSAGSSGEQVSRNGPKAELNLCWSTDRQKNFCPIFSCRLHQHDFLKRRRLRLRKVNAVINHYGAGGHLPSRVFPIVGGRAAGPGWLGSPH